MTQGCGRPRGPAPTPCALCLSPSRGAVPFLSQHRILPGHFLEFEARGCLCAWCLETSTRCGPGLMDSGHRLVRHVAWQLSLTLLAPHPTVPDARALLPGAYCLGCPQQPVSSPGARGSSRGLPQGAPRMDPTPPGPQRASLCSCKQPANQAGALPPAASPAQPRRAPFSGRAASQARAPSPGAAPGMLLLPEAPRQHLPGTPRRAPCAGGSGTEEVRVPLSPLRR